MSHSESGGRKEHCIISLPAAVCRGEPALVSGVSTGEGGPQTPEDTMIACVDVDYRDDDAVAACVLFRDWADAFSAAEHVRRIERVEPYQPGQFYKREMPCLLAVLADAAEPLEAVVVDGYVWLADEATPGLGAHLFEALGAAVPVVGVAKTRFTSA